jgi:hypothetical protein
MARIEAFLACELLNVRFLERIVRVTLLSLQTCEKPLRRLHLCE